MSPANPTARIGLVVGGVAAGVFLLACVGVAVLVLSKGGGRTGAGGQPADGVIDVKGSEIEDDFQRNTIDADRKWRGKRVRLAATVKDIGRDADGFFLVLTPDTTIRPAKSDLDKFAKVQTHDMVRVECTLTGYNRVGAVVELYGSDARLVENRGSFFAPGK